MRNCNFYLAALFVLMLSVSCEREATIPPPSTERKLVLSALISPDEEEISVYFGWTAPIFKRNSTSEQKIPDGIVKITGPDGFGLLSYNVEKDMYIINRDSFELKPGKIYEIEAKEPGGKSVIGQISIPEKTPTQFEVSVIDSSTSTDPLGNPGKQYTFQARFQSNDVSQMNYQLFGAKVFDYSSDPGVESGSIFFQLNSSFQGGWFTSENGKAFKTTFSNPSGYQQEGEVFKYYLFYLYKGGEEFINYQLNPFDVGVDPFSEPISSKTNVKGGIGYVAAYLREEIQIRK